MLKRILNLLLLTGFIITATNSWAWDDETTHRDISKIAAQKSALADGNYIKNIGYDKGLELVRDKDGSLVSRWIKLVEDGARDEDISPRWRNHYFNPLKSWNDAGLNDIWWGKASILWAQDSSNEWSWQKVRGYYLLALTSSTDSERQENFGKTFQGLGHIIHLIQDKAQPAHTRNDAHPLEGLKLVRGIETWGITNRGTALSFMLNLVLPSLSLNTITQLWDTNQYTGSNPSASFTLGLAEYSNANFLSPDTIFTEDLPFGHKHYQPYPRKDSVIDPVSGKQPPEEITAEDGKVDRVFYVKKVKDGEVVNHFAQASYLASDLYVKLWPFEIGLYYRLSFQLDDTVYKDYASLLLPRAVGYSAGLLNHFFRGQINMEKDPNNSSQYVIKNESSDDMDGAFILCYDDANENRKCFANWELQIAAGKNKSVSFTPPTSPEPKEKGKYILVFQGTLGNENGAVVGKVVKLCGGSATITISGSDAPQNGSQYTATGGEPPYTWAISKGSITKDGVVTVLGQCGTATITATDSCGNKTTKDVRMPNGVWVMTYDYEYASHEREIVYGILLVSPVYAGSCSNNTATIMKSSGFTRWTGIPCVDPNLPYIDYCADICSNYPHRCNPTFPSGFCNHPGGLTEYTFATAGRIYEWRCP